MCVSKKLEGRKGTLARESRDGDVWDVAADRAEHVEQRGGVWWTRWREPRTSARVWMDTHSNVTLLVRRWRLLPRPRPRGVACGSAAVQETGDPHGHTSFYVNVFSHLRPNINTCTPVTTYGFTQRTLHKDRTGVGRGPVPFYQSHSRSVRFYLFISPQSHTASHPSTTALTDSAVSTPHPQARAALTRLSLTLRAQDLEMSRLATALYTQHPLHPPSDFLSGSNSG